MKRRGLAEFRGQAVQLRGKAPINSKTRTLWHSSSSIPQAILKSILCQQ